MCSHEDRSRYHKQPCTEERTVRNCLISCDAWDAWDHGVVCYRKQKEDAKHTSWPEQFSIDKAKHRADRRHFQLGREEKHELTRVAFS